MEGDPKLSELLAGMTEESLFDLLQLATKRARRAALRLQAGDDQQDLKALRVLQLAAQHAHDHKLRSTP